MSKLSFYTLRMSARKVLLSIVSLLFCFSATAQVYQEYLLSGWTFKAETADFWLPAEVPGSIQNDWKLNGREAATQMDGDWLYNTYFVADEHILARDHVELVFKGIDTHADIYLNDQLILKATNMFRSWAVPVKSILKKGENKLQISFKANRIPFDPSIRKASYHFNLPDSSKIPLGIWKPVVLQSWNTFNVTNVYIDQKQISSKEALLAAIIDLKGAADTKLEIEIYDEITNRTYKRQQVDVHHGDQQLEIPFTIRNPKLWWPISMGDQNLYVIGIRVKEESSEQNLIKRIGLREVELHTSEDNLGPSISINGKPVILKGINYLPPNLLSSQMSSIDYDLIFKQVIDKNLNAIHVSGEGIYESEYFYDLADTKGILIFQDFMFSNVEYPSSTSFIENVKEEVRENITSLRQHPSLVFWTGSFSDEAQGGENVLERILKEGVSLLDPSRIMMDSKFTDDWATK